MIGCIFCLQVHGSTEVYGIPPTVLLLMLLFLYLIIMVFIQASNQEELEKLSQDLTASKIDHKLWVEQPENFPTCLATKPYPKQQIQSFFKKLKLFK